MEKNFWLERWQQGLIGFHQEQINPYLVQNWPQLGAKAGDTVLVPLCGKSKDMVWLHQQGMQVLGIELSAMAVEAFCVENQLHARQDMYGAFSRWRAPGYELLCGDLFNVMPDATKHCRFVYDRASLIALPPEIRQQYAAHLGDLLVPGSKVLLVTMEYPQHEMQGPPFSVSENEVRDLYSHHFNVEKVSHVDVLSASPRFRERGLSAMIEAIYIMVRKAPLHAPLH